MAVHPVERFRIGAFAVRRLAEMIQSMMIAVKADDTGLHTLVHQCRDHLQAVGKMAAEIRQRLDKQRRRHRVARVFQRRAVPIRLRFLKDRAAHLIRNEFHTDVGHAVHRNPVDNRALAGGRLKPVGMADRFAGQRPTEKA